MRVLFISNWFPYPPVNGAKIRVYNLICELAKEHEISLVAFARTFSLSEARSRISFLGQFCRRVGVVAPKPFDTQGAEALRALLSPLPRSVTLTYSNELEELVMKELKEADYDVVVASEAGPPAVVSLVASKIVDVPVILDGLELAVIKDEYVGQKASLERWRRGLTWLKLRTFTAKVVKRTAACTVASPDEERNIRKIVGTRATIEMVPHGLTLSSYDGEFRPAKANTLVFMGSLGYWPNEDAVAYFLQEIHPRVKRSVPGATLAVVGGLGDVDLSPFREDDSVSFTGFVDDVRPRVAESWLSVAPIRVGAGTRLKIVESMALGTPVVSTTKGAEGLAVTNRENIMLADEPDAFADAVVELMSDLEFRERLSRNGRRLVAEKYSSDVMGRSVSGLMQRVAQDF